jgi:hypothetical protein
MTRQGVGRSLTVAATGVLSLCAGLIAGLHEWGQPSTSDHFPYFAAPPPTLIAATVVLAALVTAGTICLPERNGPPWEWRGKRPPPFLVPLISITSAAIGIQHALVLSTPILTPIPAFDWIFFTVPIVIGMLLSPRDLKYWRRVEQGCVLSFPMLAEHTFGWQQFRQGDIIWVITLVIPIYLIGVLCALPFAFRSKERANSPWNFFREV